MTQQTARISAILSIPRDVRVSIASGRRFTCIYPIGGRVTCLARNSSAWCTTCRAPRCDKHGGLTLICPECKGPMVSFKAIADAQPPDEGTR